MEGERKGKPAAAMGGMYAKAKQRVLNRLGRRTTLTKNPRVDFISKRVEDIKSKKGEVTRLATQTRTELATVQKSVATLNRAMLDAYRDELGDRRWDDAAAGYVRVLHPEEKRLVADMERALARSMTTLEKVLETYSDHLADVAAKPLTFNTPEEEGLLQTVMGTKAEYKEVRTVYSDAMIDSDAQLATGADPSPSLQAKVDDAKVAYESMSERLCDEALKYEHVYREELSQRVAAHFTAEQHLLRGVTGAMQSFYPYTRGLTLDWQEMRAARRAALSARDASGSPAGLDASLPRAAGAAGGLMSRLSPRASTLTGNPFGDDDDDTVMAKTRAGAADAAQQPPDDASAAAAQKDPAAKAVASASAAASSAAASAAAAARSTSKGITDMLASYAPGGKTGVKAAQVAGKAGVGPAAGDNWANIKL